MIQHVFMIVESNYWMTSYGKPSSIYGNTSLEIPESIGSAGEPATG